jgi:lipopolysaccharide transport system ATP-binding protein
MKEIAIHTEGLSKQYVRNAGSQSTVLREWLAKALRPNRLSQKQDLFWALEGIDLTVEAGEILGIVGRNGSGKSTLLKLLSRITLPTRGSAILNGRVASLLEVGTGFHHELSGRENIYLNGAILGMRRAEIRQNFDEIVAFAGVGEFIDTPVKHYSSGMYVRLAFSVAAHLRTDILLVDEVLAVGDAAFQKKSLAKMNEVVQENGRTVLFVSHNLPILRRLCTRAIGLEAGRVFSSGSPAQVIEDYQQKLRLPAELNVRWTGQLRHHIDSLDISLNGQPMTESPAVLQSDVLEFRCRLQHRIDDPGKFNLALYREGIRLCTLQDRSGFSSLQPGATSVFHFEASQLRAGIYQVGFGGRTLFENGPKFFAEDIATFSILEDSLEVNDRLNLGWVDLRGAGVVE